MNNNNMQNIINFIESDISKFGVKNISLIEYTCACEGHINKNKQNKILICERCNNWMNDLCIKNDKTFCIMCIENNSQFDIKTTCMCGFCGNCVDVDNQIYFCGKCGKDWCNCIYRNVLCWDCKKSKNKN